MKRKYLVRTNCEYSILIEAESEEEAIAKAQDRDFADWVEAWSPVEAEEEPED